MKNSFIQLDAITRRFTSTAPLTEQIAMRLIGEKAISTTVHAVESVTLDIEKGETLGLVGESGCGKSTLGRVVAGILEPTQGRVLMNSAKIMEGGEKSTIQIQMIFQDPYASLNPRMRVEEIISEGPIAHGLISRKNSLSDATRWLSEVGLDNSAAQRFPHQFSGGQRQRIAIARALAMRPNALICDEPVASLDVSIQAQIINLFLKLRNELKITMIFISHDLSVVRHISDRIAVMYLGRIVESGPTERVFLNPQHPYTKALLESAPRLAVKGQDKQLINPIHGELPSPINPPSGCAFHLRCTKVQARCRIELPHLRTHNDCHEFACHFPIGEHL